MVGGTWHPLGPGTYSRLASVEFERFAVMPVSKCTERLMLCYQHIFLPKAFCFVIGSEYVHIRLE